MSMIAPLEQNPGYDTTAAFCFPSGETDAVYPWKAQVFVDDRIHSYGRDLLLEEVRKTGTDTVLVRGVMNFDPYVNSVREVHRPSDEPGNMKTMEKIGTVAIDSLGVVRTIAGRLDLLELAPVLSHARVYDLIQNKQSLADKLKALGLHEGSALVRPNLEAALEIITSSQVVLKPISSKGGKGLFVGSRHEAQKWYRENVSTKAYLLEERLDMSVPLPSGIRAIDQHSSALLKTANEQGLPKEVRANWYGGDSYFYLARAAHPGEKALGNDEWVFIDQDSIPDEFTEAAYQVSQMMSDEARLAEMNISIDMALTTTEKDKEPKVRVIEVNGREPELVDPDINLDIATKQRQLLAAQIARVGQNGLGLYARLG